MLALSVAAIGLGAHLRPAGAMGVLVMACRRPGRQARQGTHQERAAKGRTSSCFVDRGEGETHSITCIWGRQRQGRNLARTARKQPRGVAICCPDTPQLAIGLWGAELTNQGLVRDVPKKPTRQCRAAHRPRRAPKTSEPKATDDSCQPALEASDSLLQAEQDAAFWEQEVDGQQQTLAQLHKDEEEVMRNLEATQAKSASLTQHKAATAKALAALQIKQQQFEASVPARSSSLPPLPPRRGDKVEVLEDSLAALQEEGEELEDRLTELGFELVPLKARLQQAHAQVLERQQLTAADSRTFELLERRTFFEAELDETLDDLDALEIKEGKLLREGKALKKASGHAAKEAQLADLLAEVEDVNCQLEERLYELQEMQAQAVTCC